MKPELIEYSGYLTYRPLPPERLAEVRRIAASFGEELEAQTEWLELQYSGRDTGRKFVSLLQQLASVIADAEGEVVCQLDTQAADPEFEFYSIREGKLLLQRGRVVREPVEEVTGQRAVHQIA